MNSMNYRRTLAVTIFVGVIYILTGWIAWSYPADYLPMSWVWSTLMIAGGASVLLFTLFPKRWLAVASGTLVIATSMLRGFYIETTLGWRSWEAVVPGRNDDPMRSSFAIAGLTWFMSGVLIFACWPLAATIIMNRKDDLDE
jgi:hypothetical protein